ncbi:MAG: hypothetical protein PHG67_04335 [Bacteroidales bacterium]|jgi:hypothetical protein|nr:hypothetical protein [Bacteroidales bacterium]
MWAKSLYSSYILAFVLLLFNYSVYSQSDTTQIPKIDSTKILFFNYSFDSLALNETHYADTSLFNASYFDPLSESFNTFATLSNAGLAHHSVLSPFVKNNIGFDMQIPSNENLIKNEKDVRLFLPLLPYSEIRYTMGGKKEQQLGVYFSREFAPRFILGMDYNLINSPGPYLNNKTNNSSVIFSGSYRTNDERYGLGAFYFRNKLEQQENGGIVDDSIFINNIETDRRVIDVWLEQANSVIKSSGFGFEQYFVISPPNTQLIDSSAKTRNRLQAGRIKHSFLYKRNQLSYSDNNPLNEFYEPYDPVLDEILTHDSISTQMIKNTLIWNSLSYRKPNKTPLFFFYFGGHHAAYKLFQATNDSLLYVRRYNNNQLGVLGGFNLNIKNKTQILAHLDMLIGGYQAGDFTFESKASQGFRTKTKDFGEIEISLKLLSQSPSWFYNGLLSNHFRWDNNFEKQNTFELEGAYKYKFVKVAVKQASVDKYLFLNSNATPEQIGGTLNIRTIKSTFDIGKGKFEIRGFISYQKADIDSVMHLPEFAANLKFAFSQTLFNKAAVVQPGFNIRWFSAYYADAYMPALRRFHVQYDKKIGNYPYLDVILALKVKRANIYIQYANLFGLTGDFNYFTTPGYPMRDARFYFGVNWRFFQ